MKNETNEHLAKRLQQLSKPDLLFVEYMINVLSLREEMDKEEMQANPTKET